MESVDVVFDNDFSTGDNVNIVKIIIMLDLICLFVKYLYFITLIITIMHEVKNVNILRS